MRSRLSRPISPDTSVSSFSASTSHSSSVCAQTESGTRPSRFFHKFIFFVILPWLGRRHDIFTGKESAHGPIETQNAQRGHSTLQPLYPRRNQPPGVYGRSEEICSRWPHHGGGCRSADAELRCRPAGAQE